MILVSLGFFFHLGKDLLGFLNINKSTGILGGIMKDCDEDDKIMASLVRWYSPATFK